MTIKGVSHNLKLVTLVFSKLTFPQQSVSETFPGS